MQTILRAGPPLQHLSSQTQRETNLSRLFVVGLVLCCLFSHQQLCFCPHETRMLLFSHDLSWSTIACWKSLLGYQENIHLLWWAISMAMRWMTMPCITFRSKILPSTPGPSERLPETITADRISKVEGGSVPCIEHFFSKQDFRWRCWYIVSDPKSILASGRTQSALGSGCDFRK